MSFIYKKTIQHFENQDGVKRTAFSIVKDKNGVIQKINGIGNGETFHIKETLAKNVMGNRSKYAVQQRVYKLKSSNIKKLLSESKNKKDNMKRSESKKVDLLKKSQSKKIELPKKSESKKMKKSDSKKIELSKKSESKKLSKK
jgi:hypothetical protein